MFDVRGQSCWIGEGYDRDLSVSEFIESLAHGEDVFLTWQSIQVAVQDQHEGNASHAMIAAVPGSRCRHEVETREEIAFAQGHTLTVDVGER